MTHSELDITDRPLNKIVCPFRGHQIIGQTIGHIFNKKIYILYILKRNNLLLISSTIQLPVYKPPASISGQECKWYTIRSSFLYRGI